MEFTVTTFRSFSLSAAAFYDTRVKPVLMNLTIRELTEAAQREREREARRGEVSGGLKSAVIKRRRPRSRRDRRVSLGTVGVIGL